MLCFVCGVYCVMFVKKSEMKVSVFEMDMFCFIDGDDDDVYFDSLCLVWGK